MSSASLLATTFRRLRFLEATPSPARGLIGFTPPCEVLDSGAKSFFGEAVTVVWRALCSSWSEGVIDIERSGFSQAFVLSEWLASTSLWTCGRTLPVDSSCGSLDDVVCIFLSWADVIASRRRERLVLPANCRLLAPTVTVRLPHLKLTLGTGGSSQRSTHEPRIGSR